MPRTPTDRNSPAYRSGYAAGYRIIGPLLVVIVIVALGLGITKLLGVW